MSNDPSWRWFADVERRLAALEQQAKAGVGSTEGRAGRNEPPNQEADSALSGTAAGIKPGPTPAAPLSDEEIALATCHRCGETACIHEVRRLIIAGSLYELDESFWEIGCDDDECPETLWAEDKKAVVKAWNALALVPELERVKTQYDSCFADYVKLCNEMHELRRERDALKAKATPPAAVPVLGGADVRCALKELVGDKWITLGFGTDNLADSLNAILRSKAGGVQEKPSLSPMSDEDFESIVLSACDVSISAINVRRLKAKLGVGDTGGGS